MSFTNRVIRWMRFVKRQLSLPTPDWLSEAIKKTQKLDKETDIRLLYFPVFTDNATFTDHYYRMVWYLNPVIDRMSQITFLYEEKPFELQSLPDYLDPMILELAGKFDSKVQQIKHDSVQAVQQAAQQADVIMLWRSDKTQADYIPATPLKPLVQNKLIRRIDHENERFAGSIYLYLSAEIGSQAQEIKESSAKFNQLVQQLSSDKVYIFGTGPNLQHVSDYDFSDGVCIACNSMVKNKELMDRLDPPIITMADPIFHAGCSTYAGKFRDYLIESLERYGSYLVVPMRDYRLYKANLPEKYQDFLIGVPFENDTTPNLNLQSNYHVTTTANVMTLFLIPLACTIGETISMAGFDGRPLSEDDYFWKHDKKSQISDKMNDIQQAHPGFFAIDYNDYYLEHIEIVDQWLAAAQKNGHTLYNLTPSHIPALQNRAINPQTDS